MLLRIALGIAVVASGPVSLVAHQTPLHKGAPLSIQIDQTISGQTVQVGAEVPATLSVDLQQDEHPVLPAGTSVILRVTEVSRRGEGNSLPHVSLRAVAILVPTAEGNTRVPIVTADSMRIGAPVELKALDKAARRLIGRHDKYPTSAPAGVWSSNYQDAKFAPGDVIQLNLTEETLIP